MKKHKEEETEAERLLSMDERQRKYNSAKRDFKVRKSILPVAMSSNMLALIPKEVSEEEMEAYQLARVHHDDPMAQFMSK